MKFCIEQWQAWAPGLDSPADWQAWAQNPHALDEAGAQPACEFLPPMQRRRLSRLARITLHTAWPLCAENEQLPFVFGSRHGETPRTFALLSEVAAEQPLSPTQFGLSVHNAIAGQWSILRGQRGESVALAGEADTFEHTLLEAAGLLADGAETVLAVIAEERPPQAYQHWIADVPFSYALALRIRGWNADSATQAGTCWQLQLGPQREQATTTPWPHALSFLRAMLLGADRVEHTWKMRNWIWQSGR